MQKQENTPVKKRWDVADIPVKMDLHCTWGIPGRYVSAIMEGLVELQLIEKKDVATDNIHFNQFRIFIAHLHQNGYNTNDLPAAVEKWLNEQKNNGPDTEDPDKFYYK